MKVLIGLLFLFSFYSFSQNDRMNSSVLGIRFNGYILNTTDHHPIGQSNTFEIRLEPYFLYPIANRFSVGLMGEYQTAGSTLSNLNIPKDNYGIGLLGRYYYPEIFKNETLKEKLSFFAEAAISLTNYYNSEGNVFPVSKNGRLKYALIRLRPIGASYDLFKGFNMDLSFCVFKFLPERWRFLPNIGLSYFFK